MKKNIVLAFSGGLDTTYCAIYLKEELGYQVHSVLVNTGGFTTSELTNIEKHARNLGVASHTTIDAVNNYYESIVKYLQFGNCLKNNTYPLSVSAERICQALHIAQHAKKIGADAVAHGSTGAGNDQVRFDMIFQQLLPDTTIITPIRDQQLSRAIEIEYLQSKGINMNFDKAVYSINKGLWGTSIGGKETLQSYGKLPEDAWPTPCTKHHQTEEIKLTFEKGELIGVNDQLFGHPTEAIIALQNLAGPYGIGRDIHVGDTIIGIKGRVAFEAAAPVLIIKAHHALEKHVLTKWQLNLKDNLSQFYSNWLHDGLLLEPAMRDIEQFFTSCQKVVSGQVYLQLHPYYFQVNGIESPYDLMQNKFGQYGEMNEGYTGNDVKGFSTLLGNQIKIWNAVHESISI